MTELKPSTPFSYIYGSDVVGWSNTITFRTPPADGVRELKFLAFGDMGKAPLDNSIEHYIQPGSLSVMEAMATEVSTGEIDSIFHIGDISYATGFLVEWDYFLHRIGPIATKLSCMTTIGNHERQRISLELQLNKEVFILQLYQWNMIGLQSLSSKLPMHQVFQEYEEMAVPQSRKYQTK